MTLSGRIAVTGGGFDIPGRLPGGFASVPTAGWPSKGGWLDVDTVRTASLKGFPLQVTKVGFGTEADGRRWIGLNGAIKLADPLPVGASASRNSVNYCSGSTSGTIK